MSPGRSWCLTAPVKSPTALQLIQPRHSHLRGCRHSHLRGCKTTRQHSAPPETAVSIPDKTVVQNPIQRTRRPPKCYAMTSFLLLTYLVVRPGNVLLLSAFCRGYASRVECGKMSTGVRLLLSFPREAHYVFELLGGLIRMLFQTEGGLCRTSIEWFEEHFAATFALYTIQFCPSCFRFVGLH